MRRLISLPWWIYLVAGNLLFISATVVFHYLPDFPLKWRLFNPFNLGLEMNLATWWSSILLLALALIARELIGIHEDYRTEWVILAVLFAVLSFDEMASLHERLGNLAGDIAYLPLAIIGGALLLFVLIRFWKGPVTRRTAVFLAVGFILMASAAPQEYIEHRVEWPETLIGIRLGIEEGIELAGMFFCFAALIPQRNLTTNGGACLVPDPTDMPLKQNHFWIIIVSQIIIALLVANFIEVGNRGNPSVWIPSALFFFLFNLAFWQWWKRALKTKVAWGLISLFSLFMSVVVLYASSLRESSVLNQLFYNLSPLSILALASLFLFLVGYLWCSRNANGKFSWWYIGAIAVVIMQFSINRVSLQYIMMALFALAMVMLFQSLTTVRVAVPS